MKADVEKLRAARELVARPGGWMQGAYCRHTDGNAYNHISAVTKDAVCFCAEGALIAVECNVTSVSHMAELQCFAKASRISTLRVPDWNDKPERTQAEVVAAFDKAVQLAEAA